MNFVIGTSSAEDIEKNGRIDSRDIGMRFPGVFLSNKIHEYPESTGTDFSYHDFVHSIICSTMTSEIRNFFIDVAQKAKERASKEENFQQKAFYENCYNICIDLEASRYYHYLIEATPDNFPEYKLLKQLSLFISRARSGTEGGNIQEFIEEVKSLFLKTIPKTWPSLLKQLDRI